MQMFAAAAAGDQDFRDLQVPSSFPLGVAVTCS